MGKMVTASGVPFETVWNEAHAAGMAAGHAAIPTPMVVSEHANPLDDASPVTKSWYVGEGVCGFAWIKVTPATTAFAKWAKAVKGAKSGGYSPGLTIWVSGFGQSVTRKEAYASAFAAVLVKHGFKAYSESRLD